MTRNEVRFSNLEQLAAFVLALRAGDAHARWFVEVSNDGSAVLYFERAHA